MELGAFDTQGFATRGPTEQSLGWAQAAWNAAEPLLNDPDMQKTWLQCQGTWFVGVDVLPNDHDGTVSGAAFPDDLRALLKGAALHAAQVSAVYPGFPRRRGGESDAAFRYRQTRFGAHLDGLLKTADGGRCLAEPHSAVLGVGLQAPAPKAGPLMVWPGSHRIMGAALRDSLRGQTDPSQTDLTKTYIAARRRVFDEIVPVAVPLKTGEAVLLHRHLLHGMGPWDAPEAADNIGLRAVAYFRPIAAGGTQAWLSGESIA